MKYVGVFAMIVACSACNVMKKVDDMHDKTSEMASTTKDMSNTTNQMLNVTQGMAQTTDDMKGLSEDLRTLSAWMFNIMKQGDSSKLRDGVIQEMNAATSFVNKTLFATKYFYGFEYQIWTTMTKSAAANNAASAQTPIQGISSSNPGLVLVSEQITKDVEFREKLKAEAVMEFAKTIAEFIPFERPLTALSNDNNMKNLYALAVTLHKVNDYQQDLIHGTGITNEVSMLGILEDGLKIRDKVNNGQISREKLLDWQKEVLREEENFIYMLKLRYKFLGAMALGKISNIEDAGLFSKAKMLYGKSWRSKLSDPKAMNVEQTNYVNDILLRALQTRDFLNSIGEDIELDEMVGAIFKKMERVQVQSSFSNRRETAIQEVYVNLDKVLNHSFKKN